MGVRRSGRRGGTERRRTSGRRLVRREFGRKAPSGRNKALQPLGIARHAGQCLGMVRRLVWFGLLRGESRGRPARAGYRREAGLARRFLVPVRLVSEAIGPVSGKARGSLPPRWHAMREDEAVSMLLAGTALHGAASGGRLRSAANGEEPFQAFGVPSGRPGRGPLPERASVRSRPSPGWHSRSRRVAVSEDL